MLSPAISPQRSGFSGVTSVAYTDYSEPVHLLIRCSVQRCWERACAQGLVSYGAEMEERFACP